MSENPIKSVTVVYERVRLVVPGGPPRKNDRHNIVLQGKGPKCRSCGRQHQFAKRTNTVSFRDFCDALLVEWADGMHEPITSGLWEIEVASYWKRLSHIDCPKNCGAKSRRCSGIPQGDADASIETVADALQEIGALDDDVRIMRAVLTKHHDAANPRTEIKLSVRLADPEPTNLTLVPD